MTSIARQIVAAAAASLALAGCATCSLESLKDTRHEPRVAATERKAERTAHRTAEPVGEPVAERTAETPAESPPLKGTEPPAVASAVDEEAEKQKWCGQRFIDHQNGQRPGGAQTIEQKQADDRVCEALKRD